MHITLNPVFYLNGPALALQRAGEALIINGEGFDFSGLPDGGTIPEGMVPHDWVLGPVTRTDGVLHIRVRFPIGPNASEAQRFPEPIIDPPNGVVALPIPAEETPMSMPEPEPTEPANVDA